MYQAVLAPGTVDCVKGKESQEGGGDMESWVRSWKARVCTFKESMGLRMEAQLGLPWISTIMNMVLYIRENLLIFGGLYRLNKTHDS